MSTATHLLVGGGGFIGASTVQMLLERDHAVVVYDLSPTANTLQEILTTEQMARVTRVQGDVLDPLHLLQVVKTYDVRKVIHLAAALVPACQERPARSVQINVDGFLNVLEAARLQGVRRVVYASSIGVYGPQGDYGDCPVDEEAPLRPSTVYGACKAFNEEGYDSVNSTISAHSDINPMQT